MENNGNVKELEFKLMMAKADMLCAQISDRQKEIQENLILHNERYTNNDSDYNVFAIVNCAERLKRLNMIKKFIQDLKDPNVGIDNIISSMEHDTY